MTRTGDGSLLRWRLGLARLQLLAPFGGGGLVGGLVELDEAIEGFGQADLALRRDRLLPLLHPLVAGQQ